MLFFAGLAGVAWETLGAHTVEPTLLIIYAAMMGLPAVLSGAQQATQASDKELQELKDERDKALRLLEAQAEVTQRLIETNERWSHMEKEVL